MEYLVEATGFQFDTTLREEPSITLEYERMTRQQWTLTKEGTYRQVCLHAAIICDVLIISTCETKSARCQTTHYT